MNPFQAEVLARLPLAEAVWTLLRHVADDDFLAELFDRHRGTGSEQKVTFSVLVRLVADALTVYAGSGRKSFHQAREAGWLQATDEAVYGKLRRVRPELSQALLRDTAQRLRQVLPPGSDQSVPPALRGYRVLVVDGKKLKSLPKLLKPLRPVRGKLFGGKVLVGLLLNEGLVVAMHATPEGEANDAPLLPGLLEQCAAHCSGRLLYVADRQFCDLKIPHRIAAAGQNFVIRFTRKMKFYPEQEQFFQDAQGRPVRDALGWLGRPRDPRRRYVRQITLTRDGDEDVTLITNLLDGAAAPAEQVLELYLARWSIERVFQQVTEVFQLQAFLGASPQAAIFQFALCTLLYNVMQVLRATIAHLEQRPAESLSAEMLFRDVCDQLSAATLLLSPEDVTQQFRPPRSAQQVQSHLRTLLQGQWSPLWIKCPAKPKRPPPVQQPVRGGHSSAWKILVAAKTKPPPR